MGKKKTGGKEWADRMPALLPKEPDEKTVRFAQTIEEIQPPLIIYARESVPEEGFDLQFTGLPVREEKWHWGSSCPFGPSATAWDGSNSTGPKPFLSSHLEANQYRMQVVLPMFVSSAIRVRKVLPRIPLRLTAFADLPHSGQ